MIYDSGGFEPFPGRQVAALHELHSIAREVIETAVDISYRAADRPTLTSFDFAERIIGVYSRIADEPPVSESQADGALTEEIGVFVRPIDVMYSTAEFDERIPVAVVNYETQEFIAVPPFTNLTTPLVIGAARTVEENRHVVPGMSTDLSYLEFTE